MRFRSFFLFLAASLPCRAVDLVLPTDNDALYRGDGPRFYQYVERNFEGVISYPWEGGQYGFVRNPVKTSEGLVYRRMHEGADIKPLQRDAAGVPLDLVKTVADGTVQYINTRPNESNYGRYIVIRHLWEGCPYYSLYAHLNRADVAVGETVRQGQPIGLLGYTGSGIDKIRAHLHFEINLYLTDRFDAWHSAHFRNEANPHGPYNGMNLTGLDVGRFLVQTHADPTLSVPAFLAREPVFYRIKVPAPGPVELARRYPWMAPSYQPGQAAEISFLRSGLPVKIVGLSESIAAPLVSWCKSTEAPIGYYTKSYLQGSGLTLRLTAEGVKYLGLLQTP
jgi:murein DD-endopeptidase MepM/ murein hydrolase activator NlpD